MSNEKIDFDIDYYRILGVDEEANENEIKSAYRRLVKENHPDRNKSPEAVDVFKNVQDAYTIFKDPSLKATYDASRAMLQTGLPHFHQERKIDWGAEQIKKESGKRTAKNLAIFEQITRPRTVLMFGLPLLFGYLAFSSSGDDNVNKYKNAKPMLKQRVYSSIANNNNDLLKKKKDNINNNMKTNNNNNNTRRRGNGSGGKQVAEKYISVYKNPKTNQWERPIVANMASGVYNTWEVKSIKVSVDNNE